MARQHIAHHVLHVLLAELGSGHVAGHRHQRHVRIAPGAQRSAGPVQHPGADGDNQVAFFGNGNEFHRQHQAQLRRLPAQDPDRIRRQLHQAAVALLAFLEVSVQAPQVLVVLEINDGTLRPLAFDSACTMRTSPAWS